MVDQITRIALFGGIYNNYLGLEAAIHDANQRGAHQLFCLGDLGAFGPYPDRVFPLMHDHNVTCIQGNYDDSIGNELNDCQCGYTDPRDNHFAQLSYDYTLANTSASNRKYLRSLPKELRLEIAGRRVLLCHGSPRKTNEFLWESTTSTAFLDHLVTQYNVDVVAGTHTGIKWKRELSNDKLFVNVGALGRPENDGNTHVWYTMLTFSSSGVDVEFIALHYDYERLADEMKSEQIPSEFIETVLTGWWTTCLEILPGKERARGCH